MFRSSSLLGSEHFLAACCNTVLKQQRAVSSAAITARIFPHFSLLFIYIIPSLFFFFFLPRSLISRLLCLALLLPPHQSRQTSPSPSSASACPFIEQMMEHGQADTYHTFMDYKSHTNLPYGYTTTSGFNLYDFSAGSLMGKNIRYTCMNK